MGVTDKRLPIWTQAIDNSRPYCDERKMFLHFSRVFFLCSIFLLLSDYTTKYCVYFDELTVYKSSRQLTKKFLQCSLSKTYSSIIFTNSTLFFSKECKNSFDKLLSFLSNFAYKNISLLTSVLSHYGTYFQVI